MNAAEATYPIPASIARKRSGCDPRMKKLVALAESIAIDAWNAGLTVTDIRKEAYRRGIIRGTETGRDLSFLGSVPLLAGLRKTGRYVRSDLNVTHGNLQMVWVHPDCAAAL